MIIIGTDICFSNPGGSDAGVVVAWDIALNLTDAFDGLEDFDVLGEIPPSILRAGNYANHRVIVLDVRGTFSSNPLNVSLETFAGLGGP